MRKRTSLLLAVLVLGFAGVVLSVEHLVIQKDRSFSVKSLTVRVGDSLVFKNEDHVSHNVFSASPGQSFDLKIQRPGQVSTHVFTAAGIADIRCAIHPDMKMQVTVEE